ncbi:Stress response kinase A [compost metagenome]
MRRPANRSSNPSEQPSRNNDMIQKEQISTLNAIVQNSLSKWGMPADARAKLLSHSENAVFLLENNDGFRKILRIHRTDYHSENAVLSELAWMEALHNDAGVETPKALPGLDGNLIQKVSAKPGEQARMVVLFEFIPGAEPKIDDLAEAFHHLGSISAHMHNHARSWKRPEFFERMTWDYRSSFGATPNWGSWKAGFAAHKPGIEIVERADSVMKTRLQAFGKSQDRFGLVHSDLRLANLLVEHGKTKVLDFDDCGLGWYLYDVASSMTFLENDPNADTIISSWIEGYQTVGRLSRDEIEEIPTFMMFRRLIVMGWAGSHPDTDLAKEMGEEYSVGTVEFAQKYLSAFG